MQSRKRASKNVSVETAPEPVKYPDKIDKWSIGLTAVERQEAQSLVSRYSKSLLRCAWHWAPQVPESKYASMLKALLASGKITVEQIREIGDIR